ncbi:MAG TPA: hypothetical protein VGB34_07785 [Candidatus Limnocylindria bacterium]|jgi:hypothetical protein
MWQVVRLLVAVVATLMFLGGLTAAATGLRFEGLYVAGLGAAGLVIVLFERQRYGASPEERAAGAKGSRPTDEVFVDPTTGQRMRVWIDTESGERSYRPE